ncbi:hypothetical protein NXW25_27330 [Bacteroides ovatus]|nr:hypothetical protein [Bacteroides ovatus]
MVNKLSLMGRYRKVVLRNKRSGSACPIALHHPQQAVGALTSYMGVRNRHIGKWDKHKKKLATLDTAVSLLWILIKSIAKIEYKIRKEKRKSVLIEVYSNKLKTELSKAYLQL